MQKKDSQKAILNNQSKEEMRRDFSLSAPCSHRP